MKRRKSRDRTGLRPPRCSTRAWGDSRGNHTAASQFDWLKGRAPGWPIHVVPDPVAGASLMANDPEINQGVRQVLTRNWFDLTKTNFASRRGIVRMMGELKKLGREKDSKLEAAHLEQLDRELNRLKGVERVHFDLANWQRDEEGGWIPVEVQRDAQREPGPDGDDTGPG